MSSDLIQKPGSAQTPGFIQKSASVQKPGPVQKSASVQKPGSVQKSASVQKPGSIHKSASVQKPGSVQKSASAQTSGSLHIRMASPERDAEALLGIYAPYVLKTAITFEYAVPSVDEFKNRMEQVLTRYPYLAAEQDGQILGYAYASPFKSRAAYDWAVETSIYIEENHRHNGAGALLYRELEELLKRQHIINLNACIAYPNPESIHFHEKNGYKTVAHFTKCGYKMGTWYDMVWMEKMLGDHPETPEGVLPIGAVI